MTDTTKMTTPRRIAEPASNVTRLRRTKQSLEEWIAEAISDPDKAEPCRMITLVHMRGGTGQLEIHSSPVGGEGAGKDRTPKSLAGLFQGKAENYAQDLPGIQTFNLLAFYGQDDDAKAFHPFSITAQAFHPGLSTEMPDAQGIVQMFMRHTEVKEQIAMRERVSMADAQLQIIDFLSKALMKSQEDVAEAFIVLKDILSQQSLDQHSLRLKELEFERNTKLQEKFMKILPPLINQATGKQVFPVGVGDTAIIEGLADHIQPEQLQALLAAAELPPEMTAIITARFTEVAEKKIRDAERVKLLAEQARQDETKNPEANAAGEIEP